MHTKPIPKFHSSDFPLIFIPQDDKIILRSKIIKHLSGQKKVLVKIKTPYNCS